MRPSRLHGFTLIEMMAVVAIVALLAAMTVFAFGKATRSARVSGTRFTIRQMFDEAVSSAQSRGTDTYVIFSNVDSQDMANPPRVLLYEDKTQAIRGGAAVMTTVNANPLNIRDKIVASGDTFSQASFAFRDTGSGKIAACKTAFNATDRTSLPPYTGLRGARATQQNCSAWCTFCEVINSECIGVIRFAPDGTAKIINNTAIAGTGGLVKVLSPTDPVTSSWCLAVLEPSGRVLTY